MANHDDTPERRGYGGVPGYGRGYGRDFGDSGRQQGFDGSWGQGYGGTLGTSDYREGSGGDAYAGGTSGADYERSFGGRGAGFTGDERGLRAGARRDAKIPEDGPHRGRGPQGWSRSDERVHEGVCEALTHDPMIDAREIEVTVSDGVVTLAGTVHDPKDKALAELLARRCGGVKDVESRLDVAPETSTYREPGSDHMQTSTERFQQMARGDDDGDD